VAAPLLLTTFAPWKAHQPSNASDDLVDLLIRQKALPENACIMRQIPVSFDLAPSRVIAKMVELQPQVVVCCGMAETRTHLELELNGKSSERVLKTTLALHRLILGTHLTQISHCAGDYVCNHLYYQLLEVIHRHRWPTQALFIHIPNLHTANEPLLVHDLALILHRLAAVGQSWQPALVA
jgi:pyroglutamyl-peptidase